MPRTARQQKPRRELTESGRPKADQQAIARIPLPARGSADWFDRDYPGLALRVSRGGRRTWCHLYRHGGKLRRRALGTYPTVSLDAARALHSADRLALREGIDPEAQRRKRVAAAEAEQAAAVTFEAAVQEYHRRRLAGEKAIASADEVRDALLRECAAWRERRLSDIEARDVTALVEAVRDRGHGYWANRLFAYLRTFFRWCASPGVGYVARAATDGLTKPFDGEEKRDRVFTPEELGALWRCADELGTYEGAYLRLMLMTGKRKSALAEMRRADVGADGWWRPPQPRKATKKLNWPIPLPAPALEIVRALPKVDDNPHAFVGRKSGAHLSPGSELQRRIQSASGVKDFYWHAVRHTIVTLLEDPLRVPEAGAYRYCDHKPAKGAHGGYQHAPLDELTEDAAETWGRFIMLCADADTWSRVSAHLTDAQREEQRARKREFSALIQAGGKNWSNWVRRMMRG